ncbi:MAG: hypothetical protein AOA66_1305 [Candidatus Bathyarchaeota archaeon BA2]|nr:MAG: hypothetical protein AOA66_1305 [Candidatus Bathyarchaeota archaeon BA2]
MFKTAKAFSLLVVGPMARMFEEIQRIVEKLSEKDIAELMHSFDHCVLMVNKFEETRKPEYYARMIFTCETFMETLRKLEERAKE